MRTFFPVWLDVYKIPYLKSSTVTNYNKIWKNWVNDSELSNVELRSITSVDLQIFVSQIEYPIMRDKVKILLSDILNKARLHKLIDVSPMADVKIKKHKEKEGSGLTEEEEIAFVKVAEKSKYWAVYALMLYEGLRPGEAKAMRHSDIKVSYISVTRAMNDIGEMTSTKTEETRNVPMFPEFEKLASELRSESDELLFPEVNKHVGNAEFLDIVKSLKINRVMYSLRHTFATRCAEMDISAKQVQLWMGHSDIKTTLKYYTHISKKFEQENIRKKSILTQK